MSSKFEGTVTSYFFRFCRISGIAFIILLLGVFFFADSALLSFTLAYLLSFCFVGSSFFVVKKIHLSDEKKFYKIFLASIMLRFLLVFATIASMILVIKIHQIYFTVSFIISYIFHSVTEINFINQILEIDSRKT